MVFRHYFWKTLSKTVLLLRLSSNLQDIRLFDCKSCANNKIDHFTRKKIKFLAKKRRKNECFGVFRHYFNKTLRKFAVLLRLCSHSQDSRLFDWKRCANNIIDHFPQKIRFWASKRRKNGFFGVFRHYFRKTLRKLAVFIQLSSNLQGGRLLKCRRCAKKERTLLLEKIGSGPINFEKKRVFRGFRHYFRKTLRKLAVLLQLSSNLQGSRLFDCKRCANNKIDHFT